MAQIIDFNTAKRTRNQTKLDKLKTLAELSHSLDTDAAFCQQFGLPGGSQAEAEKLNTLFAAFQTNPLLRNLDLTSEK